MNHFKLFSAFVVFSIFILSSVSVYSYHEKDNSKIYYDDEGIIKKIDDDINKYCREPTTYEVLINDYAPEYYNHPLKYLRGGSN